MVLKYTPKPTATYRPLRDLMHLGLFSYKDGETPGGTSETGA